MNYIGWRNRNPHWEYFNIISTCLPNKELAERIVMRNLQLLTAKGLYHLQIFNYSGEKAATSVIQAMASHILAQIPAGEIPILDLLPQSGLMNDSQRLVRGSLSMRAATVLI